MLDEIELINFQSHKKSVLKLSSGFNTIIGTSDSGKSSIIRAVNWVLTNNPRNVEVILNNDGAKHVFVAVSINGYRIEKKRTKSNTGKYVVINKQTGDEETFSVLGNKVPSVVEEVANIGEMNVQMQLDSHFLILESHGRAASYVNKIIKLDKLDDAISSLKSMASSDKKEINRLEEEISEINLFLTKKRKVRLLKLEMYYKSIQRKEQKKQKISDLVAETTTLLRKQESLYDMKKCAVPVDSVKLYLDRVAKALDNRGSLSNILDKIEMICNRISYLESNKRKQKIELEKSNLDIERLKSQMVFCPYCNSKLTNGTLKYLTGESHG